MSAGAAVRYRLEADARWFLPLADAAGQPSAWVDRLLAEHEVMPAWRPPELRGVLRELMLAQYAEADRPDTVAFWYCPFGLPASAVVELAVEERPGHLGGLREELDALRSALPVRPVAVRARGLGDGIGYTRVLALDDDDPSARVAELGYVFVPGPHAVAVRARSADPTVLGLLSEELWRLVDSVVLS